MTFQHSFRLTALMLFGWGVAHTQEPACGIHSLVETIEPTYMPLARAAHVSGDVMLMTTFEHDGTVSEVHVIRGPVMLQASAVEFVKGWKANSYGGSRSCAVTVRYELASSACAIGEVDHPLPNGSVNRRINSQLYVVAAEAPSFCDPGVEVKRRRRFLGIF